MEALSPALAAEFDRVASETREALEKEFEEKVQTAVRDAEAEKERALAETRDAAKRAADEANEAGQKSIAEAGEAANRAIAEAREATKKQVTEELEQAFQKKLNDVTTELKNEAAAGREWMQEQLDQWRTFAETQKQLAEAASQPEILARFLKLSEPFSSALALYVAKQDGLALWKSRGKGAFPEIISKEITDPESYYRTIDVRGKAVAAVYATPAFKLEALDFMSSALERAIEVFALRMKGPAGPPPKGGAPEIPVPAAAPAPPAAKADPQKAHAEARKTARLLVSEIKLYHEQELKEARSQSNIYERLKDEIDKGRQAYTSKVNGASLGAHDYFHEEIVRILGESNASLMGKAYPGPMSS